MVKELISGNLEIRSRQRERWHEDRKTRSLAGVLENRKDAPRGGLEGTPGHEVSDTKGPRSRRAWRATAGGLSFLSEEERRIKPSEGPL